MQKQAVVAQLNNYLVLPLQYLKIILPAAQTSKDQRKTQIVLLQDLQQLLEETQAAVRQEIKRFARKKLTHSLIFTYLNIITYQKTLVYDSQPGPILFFIQNLSNAEKTSALAKSIFSESSADDSETISVLSKRKTKKGQQSIKTGNNKKGGSPSPPLAASATATSKRGSNKNKSSTSISQPIIKQEVTTFTSTKASADASSTTSLEKGTTRGRPPKKSAAKMAAEAASKKVCYKMTILSFISIMT